MIILHAHMTQIRPGLRADDLGQEGFRCGIAVQDAVLSAFLVIDHKLDETGSAAGIGRRLAVTDEIAGIFFSAAKS
jgi:hypothetical protein